MLLKKLLNMKKIFIKFFTDNIQTKVIAFIITIVLWLIVVGSKDVQMLRSVAISYKTSNELMITNKIPDKAQIRFIGPRSLLRDLMNDKYSVTLDLRDKRVGVVNYRLKNEVVNLPIGIKVLDVFPETVSIVLDSVSKKSVDVKIAYQNNLPDGYKIKEMTISPDKVQVSGALGDISLINNLYTELIDLSKLTAPQNFEVKLDTQTKDKYTYVSNDVFSVYLNIVPIVETKKFENIQIRTNGSERFKINPTSVDVYVEGPKLILDKLKADDITASIDIALNAKGNYKEDVNVNIALDGLIVNSVIPKKISVWIY